MKNIILTSLLVLAVMNFGNAQRVLTWSIGDIQVSCDNGASQVCYPLLVAIDDDSNSPQLSTSTIRFFYDSGFLTGLDVSNTQNGYTISGLDQSDPAADVNLGNIFNLTGNGGRFVQFDLNENLGNLIDISSTPTHVMDICFDLTDAASFPLCAAFVFDNNHCGWGQGAPNDMGYIFNSSGIAGTHYLNQDNSVALIADDEVINVLWDESDSFDCIVDSSSDNAGATSTSVACIENACEAAIAIIKTSSLDLGDEGAASIGDIITYTYNITNTGPATLRNLVVNEQQGMFTGDGTLPVPGSEEIVRNVDGNSNDAAVDGVIDQLAPGDVARFTATYMITQADINARGVFNQALAEAVPVGGGTGRVTDLSDDNSLLEDDPTFTPITVGGDVAELPLMGGAKKVIFALLLLGLLAFGAHRNKLFV